MGRARISRDRDELVRALALHASLLGDYVERAFGQGDVRYLGEIAGKLRILVYEHGRNRPLLLHLMDEFQIDRRVTLNGPPQLQLAPGVHGGDVITLRQWLDLLAFWATNADGEGCELSKKELIAVWAQQSGGAHEDWEHDEVFVRLRRSGVFIAGVPSDAAVLSGIASTILIVARDVLEQIEEERAP